MKVRNWIIKKLGGMTVEEFQGHHQLSVYISSLYRNAIRNICYKGMGEDGPTYYDWACEYCCRKCGKRDGWCSKFSIGSGPYSDD